MKNIKEHQATIKILLRNFLTKKMSDLEFQGYEQLLNIKDYLNDVPGPYLPQDIEIQLHYALQNLKRLGFGE